jgi:prolyl oligopeptidase
MRSIAIAGMLASLAAALVTAAPAARARTDGTPAADPFAYLIPQHGIQAVAWSKRQTDATRAKLEASPTFKAVLADMKAVHASERPLPKYWLLRGHRYIRFVHDKSHPYGIIAIAEAAADGRPGAWRTVFDLDAYNRTAPHPYTIKWLQPETECLAPALDRCMIPLWYEGDQDNAYIELDLVTGRVVKNGFQIAPGRNSVGWIDRNTLLVAHTTEGVRVMPSQFPAELHVWKRGTPLAGAPKIFELGPADSLFEFDVTGHPGQRRIFISKAKTYTSFQLDEVTLGGRVTDLPLPDQLDNFGSPVFTRGKLAVQLAAPHTFNGKTYPADTIVAYDFATRKVSVVMTPPPGVYLSGGFSGLQEGFAVVGVHDLRRALYIVRPKGQGWVVTRRLVEPAGLTLTVSSDDSSDDLLLHEEGMATPPRVRWLARGAPVLVDTAAPEADLRGYTVDIGSARSSDGVPIDYYLMHKKGVHSGSTPTILQGYGGFGVSDDPTYFCCHFGASWKSWFDRGGAFAIAAVRGGGERGGEWHLAGAGMNKKKMFDDFATVAKALERSGFTDAAHLGITGHSNGGILTSGAVALWPHLFGAAVIGAPVTDFAIVGHGDGGIGAGMAAEFGDWNDPAQRRVMETWDPYFNIRRGTTYPPMLVVVATTDNQVGPSHSRVFVAKMQSVGAPAMLLEGSEGGHDYPDEYTQTADMAMQMSFFIDTLMGR